MSRESKTLIIKTVKFLLVFIAIDFAIGSVGQQLFDSQKSGKYARMNTMLNSSHEIVVLGSSRAHRHYHPGIIKTELGVSCYNAGVPGQGIIFSSLIQQMKLTHEVKPDLIILDLENIALFEFEQHYDRISDFSPYYWEYRDILKPIIGKNSQFIDLQMAFKSLRLNSTILLFLKHITGRIKDSMGYIPLYGKMASYKEKEEFEYSDSVLDSGFMDALEIHITNAKENDVEIIIVCSPLFYKDESQNRSLEKIKEITAKHKVRFIDYSIDERFNNKPELFANSYHLNNKGAELFSRVLAERIKKTAP
jgi:hypothetical protein